jgi:hypothetical protein
MSFELFYLGFGQAIASFAPNELLASLLVPLFFTFSMSCFPCNPSETFILTLRSRLILRCRRALPRLALVLAELDVLANALPLPPRRLPRSTRKRPRDTVQRD